MSLSGIFPLFLFFRRELGLDFEAKKWYFWWVRAGGCRRHFNTFLSNKREARP